ncbi:uncharacterized protein LOC121969603 isoform X1 [Zingiber officinale]|uniref:uncharacterized protein LOC121969603 isoform X1 n=1 Tax=Zingiber officinale TaxID=94328 RepID=UPI001C4D216B|nr:uncharacterized protein LOC121969603 isoform X1 [Zingiber officinale]
MEVGRCNHFCSFLFKARPHPSSSPPLPVSPPCLLLLCFTSILISPLVAYLFINSTTTTFLLIITPLLDSSLLLQISQVVLHGLGAGDNGSLAGESETLGGPGVPAGAEEAVEEEEQIGDRLQEVPPGAGGSRIALPSASPVQKNSNDRTKREKLLEGKRSFFVTCAALFLKDCFVRKLQEIYFMEEELEECNMSLALGISGYGSKKSTSNRTTTTLQFDALFPNHSKEVENVANGGKETSNCSSEEFLGPKKKLKLTKEQVFLLEQSYSERDTVNTSQKQDLADRLRIQPRQVEVWFQNRRARTKTRQMEFDYQCLKRYCERLCEENRRLKKEMMHLLKVATVTASMCPSCERRDGLAAAAGKSAGKLAPERARGSWRR